MLSLTFLMLFMPCEGLCNQFYWVRYKSGKTIVVVVPQPTVVVRRQERPDHWDRARADYFKRNYGPRKYNRRPAVQPRPVDPLHERNPFYRELH